MDELKAMEEQRELLLREMETANEERNFDLFDEKEKELRRIENNIKMFKISNTTGTEYNNENEKEKLDIREILQEAEQREVNISDFEIRDGEMVVGTTTGTQSSVGNIAKTTFANYIIKKASVTSPLFAACRKETLPGKTHAIPVQKTKLGKFVKTRELANYVKQNADYDQIKLEAIKYTNLVVLSEEALEDTGYDIESDIKEQILESYAETLDELIVVGDADDNVEGLNMFVDTKGAKKITQAEADTIAMEELIKMYFSIKSTYRKKATWVFPTKIAEELSKLKDAVGRPLLTQSYNNAPFGEGSTLLGRPVIINDNVSEMETGAKSIFFGDLTKALVVGPRRSLTLKKSEEYGFLNDSIAIKANVRLDIKTTLQEAMSYYECI